MARNLIFGRGPRTYSRLLTQNESRAYYVKNIIKLTKVEC